MTVAAAHLTLSKLVTQGCDSAPRPDQFSDVVAFGSPNVIELEDSDVGEAAIDTPLM